MAQGLQKGEQPAWQAGALSEALWMEDFCFRRKQHLFWPQCG